MCKDGECGHRKFEDVGIAIPVAALELELALKIFTGRSRLIRIPPPL